MPVPTDYTAGTITLTNGSVDFTGTGTGWAAADFREGDLIVWLDGGEDFNSPIIASITSNTTGTLTNPWVGPTLTDVAYRIRYQWDSSRVSAQSRQLIEQLGNGNVTSFSALEGPGVPVFNGPHSLIVRPETDFINGVAYDVQVDTLADRDAYDGQTAGFAVLVSDVGDGRSALFTKVSNTVGDWSDPAYITGPSTDVTVGMVTELPYGDAPTITPVSGTGTLELDFGLPGGPALSIGAVARGDADVTSTPVPGGFELDFTIPALEAQGDYAGATAYVAGDIVQNQGSSWVALQSTTGNAPPTLPVTGNAFWQLLARAGNDGAGTVTSLAAGGGINIDSTDPTVPIVSVDATTLGSGIVTAVAGSKGVSERLFLPYAAADGFRSNDGINDSESTNYALDAGVGRVVPAVSLASQIADGAGVQIGDLTFNGGLAAAFDGVTNQAYAAAAVETNSGYDGRGFVGKNFSGAPRKIVKAEIYATSDFGFDSTPSASVITLTLKGKNGAAPNAAGTDGTALGTWSGADVNGAMRTIDSSDTDTEWDYVWVLLESSLTARMCLAEVRFFGPGTIQDMTLVTTNIPTDVTPSSATVVISVRPLDSIDLNIDLTVEVSRDDGASWETGTLVQRYGLGPDRYCDTGVISLAAQGTGLNLSSRVKTLNGKNLEIRGLYVEAR